MKRLFVKIALAALPAVLLGSCLTKDFSSPETVFSVADVAVPADITVGNVTAVIPVTSTLSWTAYVTEGDDWFSLDRTEHLNPTGIEQTTDLVVTFDDNESYDPRNGKIVLYYSNEADPREIVLSQAGKVSRVAVDGEKEISLAAEPEEALTVNILSNDEWIVGVTDNSTGFISKVDPASGNRNGSVSVTVAPNYEIGVEKVIGLTFITPKLASDTLWITQEANVPLIRPDSGKSTLELLPTDVEGTLVFHANAEWTATLVGTPTIENFQMSCLEGDADEAAQISFKNSSDDNRTAVIGLQLKDYAETYTEITITQLGGVALYLNFSVAKESEYEENFSLKPYDPDVDLPVPFVESPITDGSSGINNYNSTLSNYDPHGPYSYRFDQDGKTYKFEICADAYCYAAFAGNKGYIQIGKGYVKLPAVEGYRLASVSYYALATSKTFAITYDPDPASTNYVPGGSLASVGKDVTGMWKLRDTELNTSYYLALPTKSNHRMRYLQLVYTR